MKEKYTFFRSVCRGFLFSSIILLLALNGCTQQTGKGVERKVIVLGFDGMDPGLLMGFIEAGRLPNFKKLMEIGDFRPLATSMPPQSPVAWSNFITGMNPGGHGLFDFIHRDPDTILPYLSSTKTESSRKSIRIGDWVIPLSKDRVTLLRKGRAFWEILAANDIPATVIRVPANFPPVQTKNRSLSGMGTPDIEGTYGMFSYFTDEGVNKNDVSGGRIFPVSVKNNRVEGMLYGPRNPYRNGAPKTTIDFTGIIDSKNPVAKITIQGNQIILNEGEWSPWVHIAFKVSPLVQKIKGICRFYLKEVHPHFKLYVTPINIDPSNPAMPITSPKTLAGVFYEELGPFYTQGMPIDTKALSEGVLNDEEFLSQAQIVFEEQQRMLDYELDRFTSGFLFFYFGRTDQLSHMFWRTMDPNHPGHDASSRYADVIEKSYNDMDAVLAKVFKKMDEKTTLIVLSDHGFAPFYRAFNLNTWLKEEGYISLVDGSEESEFLQNVDWSKTYAYGFGFNSLYLNLMGRERKGIVDPGIEKESMIKEISEKLLNIHDPITGEQVIATVYRAVDIYTGPSVEGAPDLIIGYNRGYRASWETALGTFTEEILTANTEKWSGDHLIDADLVPGILLTNRKIKLDKPSLYDIAPTILGEFGIAKPEEMIGKRIF